MYKLILNKEDNTTLNFDIPEEVSLNINADNEDMNERVNLVLVFGSNTTIPTFINTVKTSIALLNNYTISVGIDNNIIYTSATISSYKYRISKDTQNMLREELIFI